MELRSCSNRGYPKVRALGARRLGAGELDVPRERGSRLEAILAILIGNSNVNQTGGRGVMNLEKVERRLRQDFFEALQSQGMDLEGLTVRATGKRFLVRVLVDKDGGVSLDEVAGISRLLSVELDSSNPLGEKAYTLEVSSPGTEKPLTLARHWRRNVGRKVRVRFREGSEPMIGRIVSVTESSAILEVAGNRAEVDFEEVDQAIVQVELKSNEKARDLAKKESA